MRAEPALRRGAVALALALSAACGSSAHESKSESPPRAAAPPRAAPPRAAAAPSPPPPAADAGATASPVAPGEGHLPRAQLLATLSAGFGAFLSRMRVEPALQNGRFHGWTLVTLPDGALHWQDLRPGDVVTQINGQRLEHPEEALATWQSLALARRIDIDYERQGSARRSTTIVDDP